MLGCFWEALRASVTKSLLRDGKAMWGPLLGSYLRACSTCASCWALLLGLEPYQWLRQECKAFLFLNTYSYVRVSHSLYIPCSFINILLLFLLLKEPFLNLPIFLLLLDWPCLDDLLGVMLPPLYSRGEGASEARTVTRGAVTHRTLWPSRAEFAVFSKTSPPVCG